MYESLCSGLFLLQFSHIYCSELVIVGELFCRSSETPSRVNSSARFKRGANCFHRVSGEKVMVLVMHFLAAGGVLAANSHVFITAASVLGWRMGDLF